MSEEKQWSELYGDFQLDENYNKMAITSLDKESGWIRGEIVKAVSLLPAIKGKVLLPGEYNKLKPDYSAFLNIDEKSILTAGLSKDVDYQWNFEQDPPMKERFTLIISQAMIEHLMDPYKHMKDLIKLLRPDGHLIIHTVIPGFPYHRYPIDCMRFFPDWFEGIKERLPVQITWKFIGEQRILYAYQKEKALKRKWWPW